jgi:hypothetical protein
VDGDEVLRALRRNDAVLGSAARYFEHVQAKVTSSARGTADADA